MLRVSLFGDGVFAVSMSESNGLSDSFAEIIEFCPSCFSTSDGANMEDIGRMEWEDSLDALIGNDAADGEGFADAAAPAGDNGAGEYLNALLVAFLDFAAHVNRIAYFEMRYFFLKAFAFNSIQQLCFHVIFSLT